MEFHFIAYCTYNIYIHRYIHKFELKKKLLDCEYGFFFRNHQRIPGI